MKFERDQPYALQRDGNETPDIVYVVHVDGDSYSTCVSGAGMVLVQDRYHLKKHFWASESMLTPYTGAAGTKFA